MSKHAPHPFFESADGCLMVGDRSLLDVAKEAGRTPFYVYSRRYMTERVKQLRLLLPGDVCLHYSIKANPMRAVVGHMATLVDGLDVASGHEMNIAVDADVDPKHISFAGPAKQVEELLRATELGVTLCVESELEVAQLAKIGRSSRAKPIVAVRVNPDFELKASGMKMGGGAKAFGVDAERVPRLLERIGEEPLDFAGFHIFSGSQSLNAPSIVEALTKSVELAVELYQWAPAPVRLLIIGGGFGIPYFPGERPLDLAPIANSLRDLVTVCKRDLGTAPVIELGRYLVGEAGLYVTRIVDRKMSKGKLFLITDGGLNHHLAASGNFGQIIRRNYPVMIGNRMDGVEREVVSIVGPLCTPLDILADQVELPRSELGDLVVILQSGAYGMTASPLNFLSRPPPVELAI